MINLKILGRAMGFMFLPTLGVLVMLLVGFFDPVAMWTFIKSDNGWAVFTRLFIFLSEAVLVYVMYSIYISEEKTKKLALELGVELGDTSSIGKYTDTYELFNGSSSDWGYSKIETTDPNIVIVKRK